MGRRWSHAFKTMFGPAIHIEHQTLRTAEEVSQRIKRRLRAGAARKRKTFFLELFRETRGIGTDSDALPHLLSSWPQGPLAPPAK